MTWPRINPISLYISLTAGLLTTIELAFLKSIWNIWTWATSGGRSTLDLSDPIEWFDLSKNRDQIDVLGFLFFCAFAIGGGVVFVLSKHSLQSFQQNPARSRGFPGTGLLVGFLSGFISCALMSFISVLTLIAAQTTKSISIDLLLFALLLYSAKGFHLVGLPIGIIGGIAGIVSELILRQICRATNPPETLPAAK